MKWLNITAVFVLMTLVKSGPTRNEAQDPESTTIAQIDRTETGDSKFTFDKIPTLEPEKYMLEVYTEGGKETPVTAAETGIQHFVTFKTNLETYSGSEAYFLITSLNAQSETIGFAKAKLPMFPKFPEDTLKSILINDGGSPPKQLLRLEGDMGDMTIEGGTCVSNGKTQYCSGVTDYVPCYTNGIPVCDAPITAGQATATKGDLNSVILSYNDAKSATIKLKFDADHSTIPTLDVIAYYTDTSKNQLTNKGEGNKISGSFPGTETHNLIILLSSDGKVWTTNSAIIKDRELYATILGDDIIEGRWNILDDESTKAPTPGTPTYKLRITKPNAMNPIEDIDVDCSNLEQTYCFGYFPITKTGDYTLIVAHQTATEGPDELGQVESKPQKKSSSSEPELAILSRHTKRHANQLMADVNICFEHLTPTEGRSFSHYEMLIINEKGQWLKHRILEEEKEEGEGRLCFTPFAINTKDFDLTEGTKVIVSQRGVDGFTVLATGQSKLL